MNTEKCPTCGHKLTTRKENLSRGLCNTLIKFYKETQRLGVKVLHIRKHKVGETRYFETAETTNFQKAQYFGLARPSINRGYWYLTEDGIDFVRGLKAIPKTVFVQNNEVKEVGKEKVTIKEIANIPYWLEKEHYLNS